MCAIGASSPDDAFRAADVSVASRAASTSAATLNAADVTITSPGLAGLLHAIVSAGAPAHQGRGIKPFTASPSREFYSFTQSPARSPPDDFRLGLAAARVPGSAMCALCVVDAARRRCGGAGAETSHRPASRATRSRRLLTSSGSRGRSTRSPTWRSWASRSGVRRYSAARGATRLRRGPRIAGGLGSRRAGRAGRVRG